MKMVDQSNKTLLREELKKRREAISMKRRQEASKALLQLHLPYFLILSFASLPTEINLHQLNHSLAKQGRLLLPRMEGNTLGIYHVNTLNALTPNKLGILEPDPTHCKPAKQIDCILVPGLGFDSKGHRVGYGKGFYDRLLLNHPNTPRIGIGFKEQRVDSIPHEPHDIALFETHLM